eukprot:609214-Rhodomonas_salina.1
MLWVVNRGTGSNLLVLLHGLGDSHAPFAEFAKKLELPHTDVSAFFPSSSIAFLRIRPLLRAAAADSLHPRSRPLTPRHGPFLVPGLRVQRTHDCAGPLP